MSAPGPGPPYPLPTTQSAGIGTFAIGESPVGTVIPFSYWDTIISQYANSTVITTLVGQFDAWLDQTQNLDTFYDDIWNVATASGYGLDVWGRIVGVTGGRTVNLVTPQYFGFFEQGFTVQPFGANAGTGTYIAAGGSGPFYSGENIQNSYTMTDSQFRQVIYAKAMYNIMNGSIPAINAILRALFYYSENPFVQYPTYGAGPFTGATGTGPFVPMAATTPWLGPNATNYIINPWFTGAVKGPLTLQSGEVFPNAAGTAGQLPVNWIILTNGNNAFNFTLTATGTQPSITLQVTGTTTNSNAIAIIYNTINNSANQSTPIVELGYSQTFTEGITVALTSGSLTNVSSITHWDNLTDSQGNLIFSNQTAFTPTSTPTLFTDQQTTPSSGNAPFAVGPSAVLIYPSGSGATINLTLQFSTPYLILGPANELPIVNGYKTQGNVYVQDNNNMTMTYVFNFPLTPLQEAIIYQSGVLPQPTGVLVNAVQTGTPTPPPTTVALTGRAKLAFRTRASTTNL